jgi:hypothetical protein
MCFKLLWSVANTLVNESTSAEQMCLSGGLGKAESTRASQNQSYGLIQRHAMPHAYIDGFDGRTSAQDHTHELATVMHRLLTARLNPHVA